MVRRIAGVVVGVAVAFVLVAAAEWLIHYIAPPPPGDWSDPEFRRQVVERAPFGALLSVVIGHGLAAFVGGCLAAGVARDGPWPAWVVAALMGAALIAGVVTVPHPIWFPILAIALIAGAGWLSGRLYGETADDEPAEQEQTAAG